MTIEEKIKTLPSADLAKLLEMIHDEKPKTICYFAERMGTKWCEKYQDCGACLRAFLATDTSKMIRGLL